MRFCHGAPFSFEEGLNRSSEESICLSLGQIRIGGDSKRIGRGSKRIGGVTKRIGGDSKRIGRGRISPSRILLIPSEVFLSTFAEEKRILKFPDPAAARRLFSPECQFSPSWLLPMPSTIR